MVGSFASGSKQRLVYHLVDLVFYVCIFVFNPHLRIPSLILMREGKGHREGEKHWSFASCTCPPKIWNASRICLSSLYRGHTNLCIVPVLLYVLWKEHWLICFLKSFPLGTCLLILERGEGREKNISVREKHQSVASHLVTGDQICSLGMCPDR